MIPKKNQLFFMENEYDKKGEIRINLDEYEAYFKKFVDHGSISMQHGLLGIQFINMSNDETIDFFGIKEDNISKRKISFDIPILPRETPIKLRILNMKNGLIDILHETQFRTSKYRSFEQKVNAISTKTETYQIERLNKLVSVIKIPEPFDEAEKGSFILGFKPEPNSGSGSSNSIKKVKDKLEQILDQQVEVSVSQVIGTSKVKVPFNKEPGFRGMFFRHEGKIYGFANIFKSIFYGLKSGVSTSLMSPWHDTGSEYYSFVENSDANFIKYFDFVAEDIPNYSPAPKWNTPKKKGSNTTNSDIKVVKDLPNFHNKAIIIPRVSYHDELQKKYDRLYSTYIGSYKLYGNYSAKRFLSSGENLILKKPYMAFINIHYQQFITDFTAIGQALQNESNSSLSKFKLSFTKSWWEENPENYTINYAY